MSTDVIKLLSALLLCATQALAQVPAPAPPQSKSILITGGTVHVGDGKVINDGLRLPGAGSPQRLTGELFVSFGTLLPNERVAAR